MGFIMVGMVQILQRKTSFVKTLQFNQLSLLESICIGDHCFNGKKAGQFTLKNCNKLKTVRIGQQCFIEATQFIIESVLWNYHIY